MNWVCNYCIPFPHPLQLISYSFTLYYCQRILLSKSSSSHFTWDLRITYDRAEMEHSHPPPHYTWKCSDPIGREGRRDYLVPQLTVRLLELSTQSTESSILKPEFYWQLGICILFKFRACLSFCNSVTSPLRKGKGYK